MNHRTEILPGVYLTAVQSDKFKTGCFSLNLLRPMKKEEAAANALIPSVLLRGSETCPDIASISAKLDELYGASVGTLVRKKGEVQLVGFYCDYVQDEYVDEPVFAPVMAFLAELLLHPRLENGAFPEAVVDSEKLNLETAKEESDVVDFGMRYDLTVPLSRYYSNNANNLPSPFKALQMGSVWRADRPQRGRYRQFTQCDIDILGEPSNLAEIELITATTTTIGRLGFENFEIRINERRILKAMAAYSGFAEEDYDSVFITLDKMDKIGVEGVASELAQDGYPQENIDKYLDLFKLLEQTRDVTEGVNILSEKLGEYLDEEVVTNMTEIATAVNATKGAKFELVFDPTLVRGMSYYTGTIFEISMPELGAACGGGGRYDKMIGKFTGNDVPACGFSIGFERIILLLMESGFKIPESPKKVVYLVEKKYPADKLVDVMNQAKDARANGQQVLVVRMNKNKKFQKEQLMKEGYEEFVEFFNR